MTSPRLKSVVEGYVKKGQKDKTEQIPGIGDGFRLCTLGETLFDRTGQISESVSFIDLARFVFFKETGLPLPDTISTKSPLIGVHNGTAVYLLYNGVLGDKTIQGGNSLTRSILADLPPHSGPKVVYGINCRVGTARLNQENVIFRQIPVNMFIQKPIAVGTYLKNTTILRLAIWRKKGRNLNALSLSINWMQLTSG